MVRCVLQPALAWRGSFEKRHMLTFGMPTRERARKARGKALARGASAWAVWLARPQHVDAQPAGRHRC